MAARERPKKAADAQLLRIIALNSEEVTVGPSIAEIADAAGLSHSPAQRRVRRLETNGLIQRAYRGYTITDKAAGQLGIEEL